MFWNVPGICFNQVREDDRQEENGLKRRVDHPQFPGGECACHAGPHGARQEAAGEREAPVPRKGGPAGQAGAWMV